jgi:hypothetical protein
MYVGMDHQQTTHEVGLHSKRNRGDCTGFAVVAMESKPVGRFVLVSAHRKSRKWRIWLERGGSAANCIWYDGL